MHTRAYSGTHTRTYIPHDIESLCSLPLSLPFIFHCHFCGACRDRSERRQRDSEPSRDGADTDRWRHDRVAESYGEQGYSPPGCCPMFPHGCIPGPLSTSPPCKSLTPMGLGAPATRRAPPPLATHALFLSAEMPGRGASLPCRRLPICVCERGPHVPRK